MKFSIKQIAELLKGKVEGDENIMVDDMSKIEDGAPGTLTFLSNPKYTHFIYTTKASAVLVNKDFVADKPLDVTIIRVPDAYQALATLLALAESYKPKKIGVQKGAIVAESAVIAAGAYVAPTAVIGENVKIGSNTKIYPHVHIDDNAVIGDDCIIYANVSIYERCIVGNRCILQAGAVVGSDGFGFAPNENGAYSKIPQVGNVVIEDDVEIGANAAIDRATIGSTFIRKGVKIDNLVQIAHNVEVGTNTAIAAQTGIAGSTKVGERCIFAGQVGVLGHATIANGSIFGAQTGVAASVKEEGKVWQGSPAMPVMQFRRISVIDKQLPEIVKTVSRLEKIINEKL